ncbi:MAG: tyrosine--tRNA ligase [Bacteroidetes bacterium]|nr:tyrosine--tRNA ligase [Bacteroidota bacterium]
MSFTPQYNLLDELKWRGLFHQDTPGAEELLNTQQVTGYIGFDPTADSLHVGNLVPIMLLMHLQRSGHKPVALVGGATGMVGDPSGKKAERVLLDKNTLDKNLRGIENQLRRFLDFDGDCAASLVNNYDWFQNFTFLDFIRDVGKHITVNYMMAKDSVKNRIESGISFTEFSYQLVQGYDFCHLYKNHDCRLQMGGSDQWGNIVTGTELIRRIEGGEAHAVTAPLLTKSDGSKFGKSEGGNVWLDLNRTSAYKFYQFWLNAADDEAGKLIRIFTFLDQNTIENLETEHAVAPHLRLLQKRLAEEVTTMVHSQEALNTAIAASEILFGKSTSEDLRSLGESDFLDVFEGVDQSEMEGVTGMNIVDLLADSGFLASKSEAKRELKGNSISVNKEKVDELFQIEESALINGKYILLQKGKKNYFIVKVKS